MSKFTTAIESALSDLGAELSAGEQIVVGWFHRLLSHHKAGDVIPPVPQSGTATPPANAIGSGDAAVPVVTPAPAPPAPTIAEIAGLPAGAVLTHGICGMTDAVKAKVDAIRALNPQTNVFSAFYASFMRPLLTTDDQRIEADWQMTQTYPMIPGAEFDPVAIAKEVSGLQPVTSVHPFVLGSGVVPGCVIFHDDYKTEADVLAKIDLIDAAGGYAGGGGGGIVAH